MVRYFSSYLPLSPHTDSYRPQDMSAHRRSSNYQAFDEVISSGPDNSVNNTSVEAERRCNLNEMAYTESVGTHFGGHDSTSMVSGAEHNPLQNIETRTDGRSIHLSNTSDKSSSDPPLMVTPKSTTSMVPTAVHLTSSFPVIIRANSNAYIYTLPPPSLSKLIGSLDEHAIPNKIYRDAYYSNENDAPDKPREHAGLLYHLKGGEGLSSLQEWSGEYHTGLSDAKARTKGKVTARDGYMVTGGWEYASCPPSCKEVLKWLTADVGQCSLRQSKIPSQVGHPNATSHNGSDSCPDRRA